MRIRAGNTVMVQCRSYLDDGTCIDSDYDEAIKFIAGPRNKKGLAMMIGEALVGMMVNETKSLNISPAMAFGEVESRKFFNIPIGDRTVAVGEELSFNKPGSNETLVGIVTSLKDGRIYLDTNHPLAGQKLRTSIRVISFS